MYVCMYVSVYVCMYVCKSALQIWSDLRHDFLSGVAPSFTLQGAQSIQNWREQHHCAGAYDTLSGGSR